VFFIPTFYWFQGMPLTAPMVLFPGIYCVIVTAFCACAMQSFTTSD
jgi:hypothetical protein